ncbi:MerR family transcriptional regulator [Paenibacillus sp. JX-17]|uniref:MerR family transcriptional regulator n=1 Tax=Paenibacillus lacisoli TaxID=3064525 RepID=A0ABT9CE90_9BACL|nr:MerR family transcriptional regulator [Paenibacillus sp. JX-17]MDO7906939.1 MerR family transcriptional regulator [Paenibacillus sp. JX-17]
MKIKEAADLAGISVRTLHHYDEIGLLVPDQVTEAGYRLYSEDNLEMLQQILLFRELGFPLRQIQDIIHNPDFDRQEALEMHKGILLERRARLDKMIHTLEQTLLHTRGEMNMSSQDKFKGFDFSSNPYEQEARERWGNGPVDRAHAKTASMSQEEQDAVTSSMNTIYRRLALLRHQPADSAEAQAAIGEWYRLLNTMGTYSLQAFKGLGELYVQDERFTLNMDQFGEGLAAFMRDAMAFYADQQENREP